MEFPKLVLVLAMRLAPPSLVAHDIFHNNQ
jgi:hypothetical protein